jgi:hypothetical protein
MSRDEHCRAHLALVGDQRGGGDEVDRVPQAGLLPDARQQRRRIVCQVCVLLLRLPYASRNQYETNLACVRLHNFICYRLRCCGSSRLWSHHIMQSSKSSCTAASVKCSLPMTVARVVVTQCHLPRAGLDNSPMAHTLRRPD